MDNLVKIETPRPIKGSCTSGHVWEYRPNTNDIWPTMQISNGKVWCLLCIEEKLGGVGVGMADPYPTT